MTKLLFLAVAIVGSWALLRWAMRWVRRRRTGREWLALAPRLELLLFKGADRAVLTGRHRGYPVEVLLHPDGSSQVRLRVGAPLPVGLRLSRQTPGAGRLRLRDLQDIQVGDASLDEAVIVQARNPAATIRLLREPGVRTALLALLAEHPRATVAENEVVAPLQAPLQEDACRRTLRSVEGLASAMMRAAAQHQERATAAREQTRDEVLPTPSARPSPPPASEAAQLRFEAEIREEYRRRTHLFSWISQPPAFAGFLVMGLGQLGPPQATLLGFPRFSWQVAGMGLFLVGVLGTLYGHFVLLRCPACQNSLVRSAEGDLNLPYTEAVRNRPSLSDILTLRACPHCDTRLR